MILIIQTLSGIHMEQFLYHKKENALKKYHELCSDALSVDIPTVEEILTDPYKFTELINTMNTEHGRIEVRMFDIEPEDLSDEQNKVPTQVHNFNGVVFHAGTNEEFMAFVDHIEDMEIDQDTNRIESLYRHRGWFFYKLKNSPQYHCDCYNGSHSFDTLPEMLTFIDNETGN